MVSLEKVYNMGYNDGYEDGKQSVRHGKWENYPSHTHRRCSLCKMEWEKPRFNIRANYCPNCGAKMDGEMI